MHKALILREWRALRLLVLVFTALPFGLALLVVFLQQAYAFNDDDAAMVRALLNGMVLPLLFGAFVASQLVAGEKEGKRLDSLLSLPVHPVQVWLVKYALGLGLFLGYGLIFNGIFSWPFLRYQSVIYQSVIGFEVEPILLAAVYGFLCVIVYYSLAFLASSLAPNAVVGLLFSAVPLAGWGAIAALLFPHHGYGTDRFGAYVVADTVQVFFLTVIILLSLFYFGLYHRRLRVRLIPYLVVTVPPCLLLIPGVLYVGVLMVVNHPALNTFTPRFSADWIFDQSNRDNYQEFTMLAAQWNETYGTDRAAGDERTETDVIKETIEGEFNTNWETELVAPGDTALQIVHFTAPLREPLLDFTATHSLALAYDSPLRVEEVRIPKLMSLVPIHKIELVAIACELRAHNRADVERRFLRLLASTEHLHDTGTLIATLVGQACLGIDAKLVPGLFPLSGVGADPGFAASVLDRLETIEKAIRCATPRCLEGEAAWIVRDEAIDASVFNGGLYPFGNAARFRERYQEIMSGIVARGRRPFYENPRYYWPEPPYSTADYILRPWNIVQAIQAMPKLESVRNKQAAAIDTARLARLQIYLALYRHAKGKPPATLDELWRYFRIEPITSELTGKPFPYPEIIVNHRIDLEWADETGKRIYNDPEANNG